jgi:hypothetical protein
MINQYSFACANPFDRDVYANSQTGERLLNAAIVRAKISEGFEEYLEIFDTFYADDIEVSGETEKEPIRGKANVRSPLYNFLAPLHVIAEVGGLSASLRVAAISGDSPNGTSSAWTLELVGASGATFTLKWCTLRKWNSTCVIYERRYDHEQTGGQLDFEDLGLNGGLYAPRRVS